MPRPFAGLSQRRSRESMAALAADDRRLLWHPFTQMRDWEREDPVVIVEAEGTTLIDTEGNSYIDGVSSLWCNVHGHRHPRIDAAVRDQLDRVAHSTMLGLTHEPAIELARRLVAIAPRGLRRVFYSDNGSTACEVALKMAYQYWRQRGGEDARRTRFIALEDAYHGDTIGSVSVGGIDLFHTLYRPLLFDTVKVPAGDALALQQALDRNAGEVAAVVVEPLVQGAAGIRLQPEGYLREVRELCDAHGALLVCDEVATGFGRTGTMFACDQEEVAPDFLCLSKGITGGYLPLAVTMTTEEVYAGFLGEHADYRTFFHGHTYTGNPLACAAAIATLDVFEEEQTLRRLEGRIALLEKELEAVAALPCVAEVRQRGFMVGIELMADPAAGRAFEPQARMGHRVTLEARRRGAIVRPLGDVVVLMPPLAIRKRELRRLVEITAAAIEAATNVQCRQRPSRAGKLRRLLAERDGVRSAKQGPPPRIARLDAGLGIRRQ